MEAFKDDPDLKPYATDLVFHFHAKVSSLHTVWVFVHLVYSGLTRLTGRFLIQGKNFLTCRHSIIIAPLDIPRSCIVADANS